MSGEFVDSAPPPGVTPVSGGEFVDTPPPAGVKPVQSSPMDAYIAKNAPNPADWQSRVKPIDLGNGKSSVQREGDKAVWFGPEHGNTDTKGGWFDAQGNKVGDSPSYAPVYNGHGGYSPNPDAQYDPNLKPPAPDSAGAWDTTKRYGQTVGAAFTSIVPAMENGVNHLIDLIPSEAAHKMAMDTFLRNAQTEKANAQNIQGDPSKGQAPLNPIGAGTAVAVGNMAQQVPLMFTGLGESQLAADASATAANALSKFPRLAALASGIIHGTVAGGKLGAVNALSQPIQNDEPGLGAYLTKLANQVYSGSKEGAIAGGATSGVLESLQSVSEGNPLARVFGNKATRQAAMDRAQAGRTATVSTANPQGAEMSLGEALQNPVLQTVENASEYVPFGERVNALKKNNLDLKAAVGDQASATAPALGPGGYGQEVTESAARKLAAAKAETKPLYDYADATAQSVTPVKENGVAAYDAAIAKETGVSGADSSIVKELQDARDKYASGEVANTWEDMKELKSRIQSEAAQGKNAPTKEERAIAGHKSDISQGIIADQHATLAEADPSGFTSDIYKEANRIHQEKVIPLDPTAQRAWDESARKAASRALHGQEGFAETRLNTVLNQNNPEMADYMHSSLDEGGHNAIKAQVWQRVSDAAKDSKVGFSPAKAATALDNHSAFIEKFFTPEEQTRVEGFKTALRTMERSGQYLEAVGTGKYIAKLGGIASMAGPVPGGSIAASQIYTRLSNSQAGKTWLLNMSKVTPNSLPAHQLMTQFPKLMAISSSKPSEDEQ